MHMLGCTNLTMPWQCFDQEATIVIDFGVAGNRLGIDSEINSPTKISFSSVGEHFACAFIKAFPELGINIPNEKCNRWLVCQFYD